MSGAASNSGVIRYGFEAAFERASSADGKFTIRGVANTLGVMRSGRMIHPRAFDRSLPKNGAVDLPLILNHGETRGLATVGRVTRAWVDPRRGLMFEGWLAEGTDKADEARALLEQQALRTVSIGWTSRTSRYVQATEPEIDPIVAERMEAAGVTEAFVFFDVELMEISLVDVPDDPGALLAAGAGAAGEVAALQCEVAAMRREQAQLRELLTAGVGAVDTAALRAAVQETADEIVGGFRARVLEILTTDLEIADAAADAQSRTFAAMQAEFTEHGAAAREGGAPAPREDETVDDLLRRITGAAR